MTQRHIQVTTLLCLSFFIPLHAQQLTPTLSQLKEQERSNLEAARVWADANAFPEIQELVDGSLVAIVGFTNNRPTFFTTHNQRASSITRTSRLHPEGGLGLNLTGSHITIGIWDASLVYNRHQEHRARVIGKETGGAANHATHVAGTLIASGILNEARGMAPNSRVHSYNWNFHSSEMLVEAEQGLLLSNHSYGRIAGWHKFNLTADSSRWQWFGDPNVSTEEDYTFGYYDEEASIFDHITSVHPYYLPVVSVGNERDDYGPSDGIYLALDDQNRWREYDISTRPVSPDGYTDGYDTITSMALAKNILTVGSVYADASDDTIKLSVFSSAGPTDDGRIKPDLVGVGEHLFSTIASGTAEYASYSGTSMATPNISGSLILLQQLSNHLFGTYMKAATLKGLVIHTATDLGSPGPDYLHGWGLLNAEKAALLLQEAFRSPSLLQEEVLEKDSVFTQELVSLDGGDIRITLSWTDPRFRPIMPITPDVLDNPTPVLVHDLNLSVINKQSDREYFPYVLSVSTPSAMASNGINVVDPVEQIYIQHAPAGIYSITVDAPTGLSQSSQQPFSLVISGLQDIESPIVMDSAFVQPSLGNIRIQWSTVSQNISGQFIIERAKIVGQSSQLPQSVFYEQIASLDARDPTQQLETYAFSDPVFVQGVYKYRLLFQPENTSNKVFLDEFEVDLPAPTAFDITSIYPNPASGNTTVIVDLPETQQIELHVYNTMGQEILSHRNLRLEAGRHFLTLDLSALSQGAYYTKVSTAKQSTIKSFVVVE